MASKATIGDASPSTSTSSISIPVHDQKFEATSEAINQKQEGGADDDATTAEDEAPMFHKPPPRQFALIMIA
jgi:hypothetical protein